jgi:rubrerythrin
MDEHHRRLFDLFKTAIEAERAAQHMYSEMLAASNDDEIRAIIESFRSEEENHERFLTDKYAEMRAAYSW